jgi:hypothetical protein
VKCLFSAVTEHAGSYFTRRHTLGMMKVVFVLIFACLVCPVVQSASSSQPTIDIQQPTIVAFFPSVAKDQGDADTNEALADFQLYAKQIREPLRKLGVEFQETYAHSFRIRLGGKTTVFHPGKEGAGYCLVAPGKKPRVEYGVMTDHDLLELAHEYFAR